MVRPQYAITTNLLNAMFATREGLESTVDQLDAHVLQCLEKEAAAVSQRAAWVSEYLSLRGASGCGDHGHDEAVKGANKYLKKVRKALGYTYP